MRSRAGGGGVEGAGRLGRVVRLMLLGVAVPACGGGGGATPLESASVCTGAWQRLTTPKLFDITSPILYQGGMLYVSALNDGLGSMPATLGELTPLSSASTRELWLEGDHFLYPGGPQNTQMWSLPLAGGTAELLADGSAGRTEVGVSLLHDFDESAFFWTERGPTDINAPTTVWRMSRPGGGPVEIGSATAVVPGTADVIAFEQIALAPDGVVLATVLGIADLVPYAGGPARPLAAPVASDTFDFDLAGADQAGVYWSIRRPGSPADADAWDLVLSPADGGPVQTFWAQGPPHSGITHIWPDGQGGWVMTGSQLFDDLAFHATVSLLDAGRTATRLGCSQGGDERSWIESRVAVAPDAVYAVTKDLIAPTWQIDRIAR